LLNSSINIQNEVKAMGKKTATDYAKDYTQPELREELKARIKKEGKGGAPGQWSARKAQILAQEYKNQGGNYKHPGQYTASQQNLQDWTEKHNKTS
jgi:uncharacterized protein YycO